MFYYLVEAPASWTLSPSTSLLQEHCWLARDANELVTQCIYQLKDYGEVC